MLLVDTDSLSMYSSIFSMIRTGENSKKKSITCFARTYFVQEYIIRTIDLVFLDLVGNSVPKFPSLSIIDVLYCWLFSTFLPAFLISFLI